MGRIARVYSRLVKGRRDDAREDDGTGRDADGRKDVRDDEETAAGTEAPERGVAAEGAGPSEEGETPPAGDGESAAAGEELPGASQGPRDLAILSAIGDGYFEADRDLGITFLSEPLARMTGYTPEQLRRMSLETLASAECRGRVRPVFDRIAERGEGELLTDYEVAWEGGTNTLEVNITPMVGEGGNVTGFRGIARETRLRAGIDREHRRRRERFHRSRRLEAISTLAGGIAHDFNNLLMGIQGNASLMLTHIEPGQPDHQRLKNIESCVESGAKLTSHLLGFARGGKYDVTACNLNEILREITGAFRQIKREEIALEEGFQAGVWPIEADRKQLAQVLNDIYENADLAMEKGGTISATVANVILTGEAVAPYAVEAGRYVKLTIADTGVGMDEETRMRVFEPFYTTREIGRGTGLGMASAYGIVRNHGGFIDVDSEPGLGTTVQICLPAAPEAAMERMEPAPRPAPPMGEEPAADVPTVLLVDDEEMVILVGREMLRTLRFNVEVAYGGIEALEVYRERGDRIDLVILDMMMPDMGGVEAFDLLRGIDPDVRAILSSGYSMTGQAEEIMSRGCKGFLQKPYSLDDLSDIIDKALGS